MKISPVSSTGLTVGSISSEATEAPSMVQKLRSLKMNTLATPGVAEVAAPVEELGTVDNSDAIKPATEENQPLSPQLAALAREKRALQVKEREIAAREKALLEKQPTQGSSIDVAKLKADPLGVMLESGVTYDQLTEAVLATQSGMTPELRALQDKVKALEEGVDKKFSDNEARAEQQVLAEMRKEATALSAQGEDFELIRETGSVPAVISLIEKTYRGTGEVLDVREAMKLVEDELLKDGLKIANFSKLRSQVPAAPVAPPQPQRQMRTLTNRDSAAVPLSRKARALAAWNATIKK